MADGWPIVAATGVGALIGVLGTVVSGWQQARRERMRLELERSDRERQALRKAYQDWFAMLSEFTFQAQFAAIRRDSPDADSPEALDAEIRNGISAHLSRASGVMHGILMLETNREARKRIAEVIQKLSIVGAKAVTGQLDGFNTALKEWLVVHDATAALQDWVMTNRFAEGEKA